MAGPVRGPCSGTGRPRFGRGCTQPEALRRDAAAAALGIDGVSARGRPGGNAFVDFLFELVPLEIAQGKGAEGPLRPESGLLCRLQEAGPEVHREVSFVRPKFFIVKVTASTAGPSQYRSAVVCSPSQPG